MARPSSPRSAALRQTLAQEAARIMADEGVRDFLLAKRKAADRLGVDHSGHNIPTNREIEDALAAHQRLFGGPGYDEGLRRLRAAAVEAMRLFLEFDPRLVGPVLRGTAGADSPVNLHLFSDAPESVTIFMMGAGIPYEEANRRLRHADGRKVEYPVVRFVAGEVRIEATIFPAVELRQAPVSPVDGKPMKRANLKDVENLL
ncbi:MAG: hypothetical protein LC632_01335 [Xanthomonadaceae bacterium]|nr:hypothetical protein [Xanthomonadaceae bacterium]